MSNEIWFKHKPGLTIVGRPMHWKGWILGTLFGVALASIIIGFPVFSATLDTEGRRALLIGCVIAGFVLTLSFIIAAWPHREPPPDARS